jgi:hypothetical protein
MRTSNAAHESAKSPEPVWGFPCEPRMSGGVTRVCGVGGRGELLSIAAPTRYAAEEGARGWTAEVCG